MIFGEIYTIIQFMFDRLCRLILLHQPIMHPPKFLCEECSYSKPIVFVCFVQTPEEHEAETRIKSKEARKYIFNCLDDMAQVNVPSDLESGELLAEKTDRREFIELIKRMLSMDQERRIVPAEALKHPFVTLGHLVDYSHCANVKASVQMMEVCRRVIYTTQSSSAAAQLVNLVPVSAAAAAAAAAANVAIAFNGQLPAANQVNEIISCQQLTR